jgi:hypothetical protein
MLLLLRISYDAASPSIPVSGWAFEAEFGVNLIIPVLEPSMPADLEAANSRCSGILRLPRS